MPGTSGAKTRFALLPGHDVNFDGIPVHGGFMSRKTVLPGGLSTQD